METLLHLKQSLWHNAVYVVESITAWVLVAFSHAVGMHLNVPVVVNVLPYLQVLSLLLACVASGYTIYKIRKDLSRKGK